MSEFLATLVGAGLGVWGALWLSKRQNERRLSEEKLEIAIRGIEIKGSITSELHYNQVFIGRWLEEGGDKTEGMFLDSSIKTEIWDFLSNGGELKHINDITFLARLSNTYSSLRRVKRASNKYFYNAIVDSTSELDDVNKAIYGELLSSVAFALDQLQKVQMEEFKELNLEPEFQNIDYMNMMKEVIERYEMNEVAED